MATIAGYLAVLSHVPVGADRVALWRVADLERHIDRAALRKSEGNKKEAARLLGIDRQRLYRKIEKYGL